MFDLPWYGWLIAGLSALLAGVSKTGIPGVGILGILLMTEALPARVSVGALLPLLIFADVIAAAYYRRHAEWKHLFRLIPYTLVGILAGYFALGRVSDAQLKPIIGAIILVMLAISFWQRRRKDGEVPTQWWFAVALGLAAGVTTIMANAAGPIMIIYLLAMRLPKTEFVGTSAWFFFIVNWLKVPFHVDLNLINAESLRFNLVLLPVILAGVLLGIYVLKRIPQKAFSATVEAMAVLGAIYLLLSPLLKTAG